MAVVLTYINYINHRSNRLPLRKIILSSFPVFLSLGTAAGADESSPVFVENDANAFYTEYEVIEDHPECSQPGQVAFGTKLRASGLSYRIHDLQEGRFADVTANGTVDGGHCFMIERRGTEVYKYEARCSTEQTVRAEPLTTLRIGLDVTAEIASCLSPTGFNVLGGSWSFTAGPPEEEIVNHGDITRAGSSAPKPTRASEETLVHVDYALFEDETYSWRRQLSDVALDGTTMINFKFDCIPFNHGSFSTSPLYIETNINLLLVDQPLAACASEDCSGFPVDNRYDDTRSQVSRCMIEAN